MDDLRDDEVMLMTLSPQDLEPAWHRRETESPRAFEYFTHYLLMPERNMVQLAGELGIRETTLYQYSMKHQWEARAVAYDATKNVIAEAADKLLETRIRQRIYDETSILRSAFVERALEMIEGGAGVVVTPYAYEILREHGIEPSEIKISAKIDLGFFRDVANILATFNRELKSSKGMATNKVEANLGFADDILLKMIQGKA